MDQGLIDITYSHRFETRRSVTVFTGTHHRIEPGKSTQQTSTLFLQFRFNIVIFSTSVSRK